MQSVFPQSELLRFMKQTRFDKKAQVRAILSDNHVSNNHIIINLCYLSSCIFHSVTTTCVIGGGNSNIQLGF